MNLRFGSVSSGIGGDVVAWHPLGWEHVFCSEIAEFPSAVLAARCPDVPNLGDFTAADFCDRARACGSIDVFAGGTPCQAFSVAGKRGSLEDDRGNLTLRFVEIVHELDAAVVVWENVPGVLSTEDNAFGCFLGGMVGAETALVPCDDCGSHYAKRYWRTRVVQDKEGEPSECWRYPVWPDYGMVAGPKRSLAWRILDAQHFGLAQRRRRVIVVSFRTRDGINPGAVLFEPESLRRDSPPSREEGAGVAPTIAARTKGGGGLGTDFECDGGLIPEIPPAIKARDHKGPSSDGSGDGAPLIPPTAHALTAEGFDASEDGAGRGTPIMPAVAATLRSGPAGGKSHGKQNGTDRATLIPVGFNSRQDPDVSGDLSGALDGGHPQAQAVAFDDRRGRCGDLQSLGDLANTLHAAKGMSEQQCVAFQCHGSNVGPMGALRKGNGNEAGGVPFVAIAQNARGEVREMDVMPALTSGGGKPGEGYPCVAVPAEDRAPALAQALSVGANQTTGFVGEAVADATMRVRRLMPVECSRLQGFADHWTRIPWKSKPAAECPDGHQYKGLGNAWATNVFNWLGRRLELVLFALKTRPRWLRKPKR